MRDRDVSGGAQASYAFFSDGFVVGLWVLLAAILSAAAALLVRASPRFSYAFNVIDIPAFELAVLMAAVGAIYLSLGILVPRSLTLGAVVARRLLWFVILVGLGLRTRSRLERTGLGGRLSALSLGRRGDGAWPQPLRARARSRQDQRARYTLLAIAAAGGAVHGRINNGD